MIKRWVESRYFRYAALALALAVYFSLTVFSITYPGLHFDELFFVNAALGDLDGTFIFGKIFGIPTYIMPYIGALKAWIYWPIFRIFGVSVWTIRLPILLLGGLGLALFFRLSRRLGGTLVAALALFLLVANPAFVWGLRAEIGPVTIEFLLQVAGALAFFTGAGPFTLSVIFLLGVFNKVSFAWWIGGFVIAGLLFVPERRRVLLVAGAVAALYVLLWGILFHHVSVSHELSPLSFSQRWEYVQALWTGMLSGKSFYASTFGNLRGYLPDTRYWEAAALLGWIYFAFISRNTTNRLALRFLGLQLIISFLCIFFTSRATAYWHVFHLLPWFLLLSALILCRMRYVGLVIAAALLLQYSSVTAAYVQNEGRRPRDPHWSMAIYPLIDWCRQENRQCVSLEWGIYTPLQAFIPDPSRVWELAPWNPFKLEARYIAYSENSGVFHVEDRRAEFFKRAAEKNWQPEIETRFYEEGVEIFEVYRLTAKGIPAPQLKSK